MSPYARPMHEPNQGGGEDTPPIAPLVASGDPVPGEPAFETVSESVHAAATWGDESPAVGTGVEPVLPAGPPILRGLRIWLLVIGALGMGGVFLEQAELALLVTLAGAFVAAHAADRDPAYRPLHLLLTGVLAAGGAILFGTLAIWLATQSGPGPLRPLATGIAGGAAVLSVLTAWRPLSDGMASAVFRTLHHTHTLRLGGRVVLMLLLFTIPGWATFPGLLEMIREREEPLLDRGQLVASLVGLTVLAFGGVGYLIKRDLPATLARLGLRVPRPSHLVVMAAGVIVLYLLNLGIEAVQRTFFPALWHSDQMVNRMLAGGLDAGGMILLGVSAGVGEELAMRGALQPRLGLVFTAVVFAALHVHYSWIGMGTILLLGVVLGVIRERTSTTIAILVHTLYDVLAVMTSR